MKITSKVYPKYNKVYIKNVNYSGKIVRNKNCVGRQIIVDVLNE